MKKNWIFAILSIMLVLGNVIEPIWAYTDFQTKAAAKNVNISEQTAYEKMIALKSEYPEGMPWNNDNFYQWKGGIYSGGYGCAGFAFRLSDEAFNDLPARKITSFSYESLRVGDILRMNNDGHSVVILEIKEEYIIIAEGNYNNSIHWGRTILKSDVMQSDYVMTRYPAIPLQGITLNQSSVELSKGSSATVSVIYNPDNATDDKFVTWHTGNSKVATVDQNGKVTAVGVGNTWLYAKTLNGKEAKCFIKVTIPATSITTNQDTRKMTVGTKYQFKATVTPNDTTSTIKWRTGNSKVATVDQNGKVTAVSVGNTWLYATTSNGLEAKTLIQVIPTATNVKIVETSKEISLGSTYTFKATVNPNNASQIVTWRTGNSKVATVDKNGKVTAVSVGNTWLYAKTSNGKEAKCLVKIVKPATSITTNQTTRKMSVGTKYQFKATVTPSDTTSTIKWRVGNSKVATVDQSGKVSAVSVGNTWLYATTSNGLETKTLIQVILAATDVKINETSKEISLGSTYTFKATVNPSNASQIVTWRTGNSKVATVDKNGKVTAVGKGNTWLYATTWNGKEIKCLIKVH